MAFVRRVSDVSWFMQTGCQQAREQVQSKDESIMKAFIRLVKALFDPIRVKVLQHRSLCVCEIKEALGIAQSMASKHLRVLEDAYLVINIKDGLWVCYSLSSESESPLAGSMIGNLKHWLDGEPEIKVLNKILPEIDRHNIVGKE